MLVAQCCESRFTVYCLGGGDIGMSLLHASKLNVVSGTLGTKLVTWPEDTKAEYCNILQTM
jgi:hypothetical protein